MPASAVRTGGPGMHSGRVQACIRLQRSAALPAPDCQGAFAAVVGSVETGLRQEESMM